MTISRLNPCFYGQDFPTHWSKKLVSGLDRRKYVGKLHTEYVFNWLLSHRVVCLHTTLPMLLQQVWLTYPEHNKEDAEPPSLANSITGFHAAVKTSSESFARDADPSFRNSGGEMSKRVFWMDHDQFVCLSINHIQRNLRDLDSQISQNFVGTVCETWIVLTL